MRKWIDFQDQSSLMKCPFPIYLICLIFHCRSLEAACVEHSLYYSSLFMLDEFPAPAILQGTNSSCLPLNTALGICRNSATKLINLHGTVSRPGIPCLQGEKEVSKERSLSYPIQNRAVHFGNFKIYTTPFAFRRLYIRGSTACLIIK